MEQRVRTTHISLVVPSFNQARYLEQTLQSVLDQGYPHLQLGVVDGGSTDGSASIIEKYRHHLAFAIIEKDRGQADAINKGLRRCTGDVVGWLCSDDVLMPDALQHIGDHFAEYPDCDWLAGRTVGIDETGQAQKVMDVHGDFSLLGILLRTTPFSLPQPAVYWRRSWHDRLGFLDEKLHYCMDFDWWCRLLAGGVKLTAIESVLAGYRFHDHSKSVTQPTGFLREHEQVERRYLSHLPWMQRWQVSKAISYRRRLMVMRTTQGRPWQAMMRHPWWLCSADFRRAIWSGAQQVVPPLPTNMQMRQQVGHSMN